jgi:Uma2 family endonuclease
MATTAGMSGVQFDALPYEEGRRWELLDGELVEVPSPASRHQAIVSRLIRLLQTFLEKTGSQGFVLPDVEFALRYGTTEVWQLYPKSGRVHLFRGGTGSVLDSTQEITTDLLPGFAVPVASFFESLF